MDAGTYEVVGFERYPDACLVVENDTVQFFNIDLNEIYREGQADPKTGTFTYSYSMYPGQWGFGLGIEYDSFHKTIHIGHYIQELTFQK